MIFHCFTLNLPQMRELKGVRMGESQWWIGDFVWCGADGFQPWTNKWLGFISLLRACYCCAENTVGGNKPCTNPVMENIDFSSTWVGHGFIYHYYTSQVSPQHRLWQGKSQTAASLFGIIFRAAFKIKYKTKALQLHPLLETWGFDCGLEPKEGPHGCPSGAPSATSQQ